MSSQPNVKGRFKNFKTFFFWRVLSVVIFNSWHGVTDSSDDPVSMLKKKKKRFVLERVSCKIHNILINASLKSKTVDCWLIMTAVEMDGSLNLSRFWHISRHILSLWRTKSLAKEALLATDWFVCTQTTHTYKLSPKLTPIWNRQGYS